MNVSPASLGAKAPDLLLSLALSVFSPSLCERRPCLSAFLSLHYFFSSPLRDGRQCLLRGGQTCSSGTIASSLLVLLQSLTPSLAWPFALHAFTTLAFTCACLTQRGLWHSNYPSLYLVLIIPVPHLFKVCSHLCSSRRWKRSLYSEYRERYNICSNNRNGKKTGIM